MMLAEPNAFVPGVGAEGRTILHCTEIECIELVGEDQVVVAKVFRLRCDQERA